jgi:hypothetical protein
MNALDALRVARDAGVRVRIDGDDLVLEAVAAPPPTVIEVLSRYKAAVLRELRETANDTANVVVANGIAPVVQTVQRQQETFDFAPPGDPANDDEALRERAAILEVENGWDAAKALQEARWQADRERCWRTFLRNAARVLAVDGAARDELLRCYQNEASRRYGDKTGRDMAVSLWKWVNGRGIQ